MLLATIYGKSLVSWSLPTQTTCPYLLARAASLIVRARVEGPGGSAFSNILGCLLLISVKLETGWLLEAQQKAHQALIPPHEGYQLFFYLKHLPVSILEMLILASKPVHMICTLSSLADVRGVTKPWALMFLICIFRSSPICHWCSSSPLSLLVSSVRP